MISSIIILVVTNVVSFATGVNFAKGRMDPWHDLYEAAKRIMNTNTQGPTKPA